MDHKIRLTGLTLIEKDNVVMTLKIRYRWVSPLGHSTLPPLQVGEWTVWRDPSDKIMYAHYMPLESEIMLTAEDVELLSSVHV